MPQQKERSCRRKRREGGGEKIPFENGRQPIKKRVGLGSWGEKITKRVLPRKQKVGKEGRKRPPDFFTA